MSKRTESHKRIVYKKKALNQSFQNLNLSLAKDESFSSQTPIKKPYFSRSVAKLPANAKTRSESIQRHDFRLPNESPYTKAVRIHRPTRSMHEGNLNFLSKMQAKSSDTQSKFLASQSAFKKLIESGGANASILSEIKASYEEYINAILKKPSKISRSVQCSDLEIRLLSRQSDDTEDTVKREIPKINLKPTNSVDGFHDEFMQNYDDFSESWRRLIDQQQKNL